MNKNNVLCVFVKYPFAGQVKTRLQPEVSPEDARDLYATIAEDMLNGMRRNFTFDLAVFFWPPKKKRDIREWLGNEYWLIPQSGSDLGERMFNAVFWAQERSYEKTVIVGSDIPDLNVCVVDDAFTELNEADVVLGPSSDGGYYLIGMKKPHPELFEGISWGGPGVFRETAAVAYQKELSLAALDELKDIDTFHDLDDFRRSVDPSSQKKVYKIIESVIKRHRRGES